VTLIRVQIVSDFHAELDPSELPFPGLVDTRADIVIVAGDMASAYASVDTTCDLFPDAAVIAAVAGNHEHYRTGLTIPNGVAVMRSAARHASDKQGRDIILLENDERVVTVRDVPVRFIGCTLWTDYALFGEPDEHAPLVHSIMNDSRRIQGSQVGGYYSNGLVTFSEIREQNAASVTFLEEVLSRRHDGPTVVVTHHLPSARSIAAHYKGPVNAAFASNLDYLVAYGAALWVHGHTHSSIEWREPEGGTLVVCNPAGYARAFGSRENKAFRYRMVVCISCDASGQWMAKVEAAVA